MIITHDGNDRLHILLPQSFVLGHGASPLRTGCTKSIGGGAQTQEDKASVYFSTEEPFLSSFNQGNATTTNGWLEACETAGDRQPRSHVCNCAGAKAWRVRSALHRYRRAQPRAFSTAHPDIPKINLNVEVPHPRALSPFVHHPAMVWPNA